MGTSPPRPPPAATSSFSALFHAHKRFVTRLAQCAGVRWQDVPDVVQQVFMALHEAMGRGLDTTKPLWGWLRAVTFRIARDHLHLAHHAREVPSPLGIEVAGEAPSAEEHMVKIDVHRLVDQVLETLPPELRIVLAMSDIAEMSGREIAEVLELPEGTVYSRLRAARRAFEVAWNEQKASGNAAVMPFALWGAGDLLHAARPLPDVPDVLLDEVWRRLVAALGPGITAGAAGVAVVGAGAMLSVKHAAVGALLAALIGAGAHAALAPRPTAEPPPSAVAAVAAPAAVTVEPAATVVALVSAVPDVRAPSPSASAPARSAEAAGGDGFERRWLETARDAYERGDLPAARAALARVKSPRFAAERDELRRLLAASGDGGVR